MAILLLALGLTVGCDQTSKHFARSGLGESGSISLPNGLGELRLAENPGGFLSLAASLPEALRVVLLTFGVGTGLLALLGYLAFNPRLKWVWFIGLAMIWAGGTSNLIDRVTRQGLVTDFIFLRVGPIHTGVFNAADMVILLGVAVCLLGLRERDGVISDA